MASHFFASVAMSVEPYSKLMSELSDSMSNADHSFNVSSGKVASQRLQRKRVISLVFLLYQLMKSSSHHLFDIVTLFNIVSSFKYWEHSFLIFALVNY